MKKLTRIQQIMASFFIVIIVACTIGNALGYWLFYRTANNQLLADIDSREKILLEKLELIEKLQRDLQYHSKQLEQYQKEKQQLQQALEFHHQLMDKNRLQEKTGAAPPSIQNQSAK